MVVYCLGLVNTYPFFLILATFNLQSGYKMEDLSSQEAWGEDVQV